VLSLFNSPLMTPHIELTKQGNFAGWETGQFNPRTRAGTSVLFAEPDFGKPKVVYDYSHQSTTYKYLFILNPGYHTARVQINALSKDHYRLHLSLLQINELYAEQVQGHPVPKADFKTNFMVLKIFKSYDEMMSMKFFEAHAANYGPKAVEFLKAAMEKAMAPAQEQKLFWGVPRTNQNAA
jgi:hypothetical protein